MVHRLAEVGSTQDALHRLAESGAPTGTAVVAEVQRAGRGSRGRGWESPPGGLWMSVLWRPGPGDDPRLLSLRAGLAVADVLEGVGGLPPVQLKWPNDVLVAGRKLGGILCEARWHGAALGWVVIGLGLNVANAPPAGVRVPAAALIEWRPDLTAATLAQPMASALAVLDGGSRLAAGELAAWRARDGLAGRRLRAPVAGTVQGLADDGALEVAGPHGVERIAPGDTAALELA